MKKIFQSLVILLFITSSVQAQIFESWRDTPPDLSTAALMGAVIESEGIWTFVGSLSVNRVFIYKYVDGDWEHWQNITPSSGGERFGRSIDIDGDMAVIGDELNDNDQVNDGAFFVFKLIGTTWQETAKVESPNDNNLCDIGHSVAIDEGRIACGARACPDNIGSIMMFSLVGANWLLDTTLMAMDTDSAKIGSSMELEGDILVTAGLSDNIGAGALYFFKFEEGMWVEKQKIVPPDTVGTNTINGFGPASFGRIMDLEGSRLVFAGSGFDGPDGILPMGKAYYMELEDDLFEFKQSFIPIDTLSECQFGTDVDLFGDELIIGAQQNPNEEGDLTGAVYWYRFNGEEWMLQDRLWASEGEPIDFFGGGCSLTDDGSVIVGALGDDEAFSGGGELYFYNNLIVGVPETISELGISVFPNPSSGVFQVDIKERNYIEYGLYDRRGKFVKFGIIQSNNSSIDCRNLESGLYHLVLKDKESKGHVSLVIE